MSHRSQRCLDLAAVFLLFGGVACLVYEAVPGGSVYFLNVAEAAALPAEKLAAARIYGRVAGQSPAGQKLDFSLADARDPAISINVSYGGVLPDAFRNGAEVIVEGGMSPDGNFMAKRLMTKCPSRYQSADHGGKNAESSGPRP